MNAIMFKFAARKIGDFVSGDGSMWSKKVDSGNSPQVSAYERIANKKVQTKGSISRAGRMNQADKPRLNVDQVYRAARARAQNASEADQKSPNGGSKNAQRLKLWKKSVGGNREAARALKTHGRLVGDREGGDKHDWTDRDMKRREAKMEAEAEKHRQSKSSAGTSNSRENPKGKGLSTGAKVGIGVGIVGAAYGAKKLRDHIKARRAKKDAESKEGAGE